MVSMPRFEPGPHWWEASALTTAPSLAPGNYTKLMATPQSVQIYLLVSAKRVTINMSILMQTQI